MFIDTPPRAEQPNVSKDEVVRTKIGRILCPCYAVPLASLHPCKQRGWNGGVTNIATGISYRTKKVVGRILIARI